MLLSLVHMAVGVGSIAAPLVNSTKAAWQVLPNFQATIATGVSFTDINTGIIIGGQDGAGAAVWRTQDGGGQNTLASFSGDAPPLLLLHGASAGPSAGPSAVASGIFAAWHSSDGGVSFQPAQGPGSIGPAQSVDGFTQLGQNIFVIVGDTLTHNGVAVSTDGGSHFNEGVEVFNDRSFEANIGARYGAFPSENTWFVSGGRWPSSDLEEDEGLHFLSQNIYVKKNATGAEYAYGFVDESQHRRAQDTNPFTAGIARSVDRGATWETVFETDTAGYYFNQISCFDDNNCVVVAEGGGSARIFTSNDRGASWQQTLDATGSLMAVQCIEGTGEGWAAGGILGIQFVGHYWHTMDFGATWQLVEVPGVYAFDVSFPPNQNAVGFSSALTPAASRLVRYGN